MKNPFSLDGKTILVTGASSGIGRGIAVACAGMGASVVLTARNRERLEETYNLLEREGHQIILADLTNPGEVQELVNSLPQIDGLVQCAGVMNRVPCKLISQKDINSVLGQILKLLCYYKRLF